MSSNSLIILSYAARRELIERVAPLYRDPRGAQRDAERHIATEVCCGKRYRKPATQFSSSSHMLVIAA